MAKKKSKRKRARSNARKKPAQANTNQEAAALKTSAPISVPKKKPAAKTPPGGLRVVEKVRQFFREVRIELLKVNWPTRKETIASTGVVVVLVILISVYLGLVDAVISRVMRVILG